MTPDTGALWTAVDALTKPSTMRLFRDDLEDEWWIRSGYCDIAAHRASTVSHGNIPCLWEQAELALTTGSESAGGNPSPLAARSPADLDLMEMMLTIRESMAWQLPGRGVAQPETVPAQIRRLAAHVISHEPENVAWWTYRFAQWARTLAVYLHAVETGPKPRQLRFPCPQCQSERIVVDYEDGPRVEFPIVVDFVNGVIRAATCRCCGYAKWRGQDLWDLADEVANAPRKTSPLDETMNA